MIKVSSWSLLPLMCVCRSLPLGLSWPPHATHYFWMHKWRLHLWAALILQISIPTLLRCCVFNRQIWIGHSIHKFACWREGGTGKENDNVYLENEGEENNYHVMYLNWMQSGGFHSHRNYIYLLLDICFFLKCPLSCRNRFPPPLLRVGVSMQYRFVPYRSLYHFALWRERYFRQ